MSEANLSAMVPLAAILTWAVVYTGVGVALLVAGIGLALMKGWGWILAFVGSVAALGVLWPVVASEIDCATRPPCIPSPGLFPLPIVTELLLGLNFVGLLLLLPRFFPRIVPGDHR